MVRIWQATSTSFRNSYRSQRGSAALRAEQQLPDTREASMHAGRARTRWPHCTTGAMLAHRGLALESLRWQRPRRRACAGVVRRDRAGLAEMGAWHGRPANTLVSDVFLPS